MLRLVLDTNIVLDWLVFADPALEPLAAAVTAGRARVLRHDGATDELRRVLAYPSLKLDQARQAHVLDLYCMKTAAAELPWELSQHDLRLPPNFPRCRDRDDQYFLALAYHARADALVSRDKCVLALRKKAGRFDMTIVDIRQLNTLLLQGPGA